MRPIARLFASCLLFASLSVSAAQVEGLYEVREPVASQEPSERAAAMSRALQSLAVRLTGQRKVAQDARLKPLLADPQQLVQQFVYEPGTPVMLSVVFDPVLSQRALQQAGFRLWNVERPNVLVWWLNEQADGGSLLASGQEAAVPLRSAAQSNGVPLSLPLGDLDEQLLVSAEALRASDTQALQDASARYGADALLAVVARAGEGGGWQADWQFRQGAERTSGSASAASQAALADAVLQAVGEHLAAGFGKGGAAQALTLEVAGNDLARYAAVQRLLEPFSPRLEAVVGDKLVYRLDAGSEQLRSQLKLGRLHEVPAEPAQPGAVQPLLVPAQPASRLQFAW